MIGPVLFTQTAQRALKFSIVKKNNSEKTRNKKQTKKSANQVYEAPPERNGRVAVSELMLELNNRMQQLSADLNRKWLNGSISFEEYRQQVQALCEDFANSINHSENSAA